MVPLDFQTITKLDAAVQQVEAAIELFHEKRYAPAITLAAAAEGCLLWQPPSGAGDADPPSIEPLLEVMKRGAKKRFGKTEKEAIQRFNKIVYWLKHATLIGPTTEEVSNWDAWSMIVRAVTKIEAVTPGRETPDIAAFIEFSRQHYSDFVLRR